MRWLAAAAVLVAGGVFPLHASAQTAAVVDGGAVPAAPTLADVAPAVVATVGERELTREELAAVAVSLVRRQALEALISHEVVRQEAKRQGVTATQEEIDAYTETRIDEELRAMARRLKLKDVAALGEHLGKTGDELVDVRRMAEATIRPFVGPELLARKLLRRTVEISDGELRAAFEREYGPKARIRQIVVPTRADAEEVIRRLKMGLEFGRLAKGVSIDRVSRPSGGELAPIPLSSRLGESAFRLKPGQISDVIQTPNGFHVIELLEKIPARTARFEEAKEALQEQLVERKLMLLREKWLADLTRKVEIKRRL